MIPELVDKKAEIQGICSRYPVQRLAVFGSAVRGDFVSGKSDIDFLVRIKPCSPAQYADIYFSLYSDLTRLFSAPIDLITEPSITNPYLLQSIKEAEQELYVHA
jgi:predicted nucleotidyltransferase